MEFAGKGIALALLSVSMESSSHSPHDKKRPNTDDMGQQAAAKKHTPLPVKRPTGYKFAFTARNGDHVSFVFQSAEELIEGVLPHCEEWAPSTVIIR